MSPLLTDSGLPITFDIVDPYLHHYTVGPADVDAMRHVNNARYVAWMDRAAYAHSAHLGYDMAAYQKLNAAFVVRRHEIDYLAEAFEGERVVVATWPCMMERFTATRRHQIVRISDGTTLVRALTTWVFIDTATGRPRRMPADLIATFRPREM